MKRILLVTSVYTGAGHQSISESLTEQFSGMPDVEVQVIDGFELAGRIGVRASKVYGTVTRHAPAVYNAACRFLMKHPPRFGMEARLYSRRFMACIRRFHPDLILTVHSLFNIVLTRMLKRHGLNIPVVVLQADIINIHSTWCNEDARMTICPTQEAFDASVRQGMRPEKMTVLGLPVRSRFCVAARTHEGEEEHISGPLRCLMMSGGEGSGSLKAYAEAILEDTEAELTIICGRNKKLYHQLRSSLNTKYGSRVNVLGFVKDIEQIMMNSDLLIARGSPNTLYEAVMTQLPVIIVQSCLWQEVDNAGLMQHYGLGVGCESSADAPRIIQRLLSNHGAGLQEIRAAQHDFRSFENAREIAERVAAMAEPLDYTV